MSDTNDMAGLLSAAIKRIAELEDAFEETVEFIRNRHNYGPRVREARRLAILKRHSGIKEVIKNDRGVT